METEPTRQSEVRFSVDEDIPQLPVITLNLCLALLICNYCAFCFGSTITWTNAVQQQILRNDSNIYYSFTSSEDWVILQYVLPATTALSSLPMGAFLKMIGCKMLMIIQVIPYVTARILTLFAKSMLMISVGRVLQGISGAAVSLAVPVYIDEICQAHYRGRMGCLFYGAVIYGIICGNLMLEYISFKLVNFISLLHAIVFLTLILIPESPSYYMRRQKEDKALGTVTWLRGTQYDAELELKALSPLTETIPDNPYPNATSPILRACVMMIFQGSGAMVIYEFLSRIISDYHSLVLITALILIVAISHVTCVSFVDVIGRRPLLMISVVLMLFCSIYMSFQANWYLSVQKFWITLLFVYVLIGSYMVGLGPISWLLNTELILPQDRPCGCAIASFFSWITVTLTMAWSSFHVHIYFVLFFMLLICLSAILFIIVFLPETKDTSNTRRRRTFSRRYDSVTSTGSLGM